jgi:hypothetical protein
MNKRPTRPKQRTTRTSGRTTRAASRRARQNLRRSIDRWAERTSARAAAGPAIGLIGLDVSRPPQRLRRSWMPLLVAGVVGALFLAVLRMDVIRMRFQVAQTFEEEMSLQELKRELTVDMRQLRDPAHLARRAEKLGFRRAERLIDLEGHGEARGMRDRETRPERPEQDDSVELAAAGRRRTGGRP